MVMLAEQEQQQFYGTLCVDKIILLINYSDIKTEVQLVVNLEIKNSVGEMASLAM